jgi:hypothetical protein
VKNSINGQLDLIFSSMTYINISEPSGENKILKNTFYHSAIVVSIGIEYNVSTESKQKIH